jgi:uncharacterized protein (TIGR02996 family)
VNDLEEMLTAIVLEPSAEDRWLVLADWLEEFDDPLRAELLGCIGGSWRHAASGHARVVLCLAPQQWSERLHPGVWAMPFFCRGLNIHAGKVIYFRCQSC